MKKNLEVMREGVHSFHTNCAQKERYNIIVRRRGRGREGGVEEGKEGKRIRRRGTGRY